MTDSTPREETPVTSTSLINLSGFSLPPPPGPASSHPSDDFPPASLSLPMLAPRSFKHRRRAEPETSDSHSLMSFVSHMSLSEVAQTFSSGRTCYAPTQRNPFLPTAAAPELEEEPLVEKSVGELAAMAMDGRLLSRTTIASMLSFAKFASVVFELVQLAFGN